ncbi:MAG TPA: hypothetical protein VG943_11665 [Caulobacterales bacterium]|nr:hypothetical protein [Caulobacterales bacterium]
MMRARNLAISALCLVASGCAAGRAPVQLAGLWSAGPAACEAGMGVRFDSDEVAIVYDRQRQVLFDRPHYSVEEIGARTFRVRIRYDLPHQPGGAQVAGAYGVLVLEGEPDGGLHPMSHNLVDARTGSVRLRIDNDPAISALSLRSCERTSNGGPEELRGRTTL